MKPFILAASIGAALLVSASAADYPIVKVGISPEIWENQKNHTPASLPAFWSVFVMSSSWQEAREKAQEIFGPLPIVFNGTDDRCPEGRDPRSCLTSLIVLDIQPMSWRDDVIHSPMAAVDITMAHPVQLGGRFRQAVQLGYMAQIEQFKRDRAGVR